MVCLDSRMNGSDYCLLILELVLCWHGEARNFIEYHFGK